MLTNLKFALAASALLVTACGQPAPVVTRVRLEVPPRAATLSQQAEGDQAPREWVRFTVEAPDLAAPISVTGEVNGADLFLEVLTGTDRVFSADLFADGLLTRNTYTGRTKPMTVEPGDGNVVTIDVRRTNLAPTLTAATLAPGPYYTDSILEVAAEGYDDANGDAPAYVYAWFVNDQEVTGQNLDTLDGSFFAKGDRVRARVTPSDGILDGAPVESEEVFIINSIPVASALSIPGGPFRKMDDITVVASGSDADGDPITFSYRWTLNGVTEATTAATYQNKTKVRGDVIGVSASPSDGDDFGAATPPKNITVANSLPVLASVSLSPASPTQKATLAVSRGTVQDDDGDPITYSYQWHVNGAAAGTDTTLAGVFVRGDSVSATVKPYDGVGLGTPVSTSTIIVNAVPSLAAVSLGAGPYTVADTLTPGSTGYTDHDGDSLAAFEITWFVNGAPVSTGTTLPLVGYAKGDTVAVAKRVSDGISFGAWVTSAPIEIQNAAPVMTSVSFAPVGPVASSTLTATAAASDADGADNPLQAADFTYVWYVNGVSVDTGTTLAGAFSGGDTVAVEATYFDGTATSYPLRSVVITVGNSAPVITEAADLGAGPFYSGSSLGVVTSATASDPDAGDEITFFYQWYRNDNIEVGKTGSTYTGAKSIGDSLYVEVTASDGAASAVSNSNEVTIVNELPEFSSVDIGTGPFTKLDTLSISANGYSDADGHTKMFEEYKWYVDGEQVATTSTLNLSGYSKGAVVYATARAYDGFDYGPPRASASITIQNAPPAAPSLSFLPTPYVPGGDIYVTAASSDADSDSVTYQYRWFKNGVDQAYPSSATLVASAQVGVNSTWVVVVTPNDGYADGATAWASKLISSEKWSAMSAATAPTGRYGHSAVWTGSEMIVWGGSDGISSFVDTGGRYNPAIDTWYATPISGAPSARWRHTAVWTGREMIVWGGSDGTYLGNGARYSPATNSWASVMSSGLTGRDKHTAVWTGSEMIVWGGWGDFGEESSGARYEPITNFWTSTAAPDVAGRYDHSAVWSGKEMLIWGGNNGGYLNTGSRYDPGSNTWSAMTNSDISGRAQHQAVWTGKEMLVWGGIETGSPLNDGSRFDPIANTWTSMSASGFAGAIEHSTVWTGREMFVWGGWTGSSSQNAGRRYDPRTNTWAEIGATGLTARGLHTAVWTGQEMIVWGGNTSGGPASNGARYYPPSKTETWISTAISGNTPSARYLHSMVWTGAEVIVWGGNDGVSQVNSGGRYNPATDTWASTSLVSAPTARSSQMSVWTGREMLVWGGSSAKDGARYNPLTNSWTPMATNGQPGGGTYRMIAPFVWTGREMIIWGGYDGGYPTDGARFNPALNVWTATASANAPPGRHHGRGVWTGSEMLVWGGHTGGPTPSDGYRYDPDNTAAGSWSSMTTSNAPTGRYFHTIVWTGKEMIIWGGQDGGGVIQSTMGRYDPGTNTWTSGATAPITSRSANAFLWTGSEVLVWGGFNGSTTYSDGAAYDPRGDTWRTLATTLTTARHFDSAYDQAAVWTGREMIFWGGYGSGGTKMDTGVRYTPPTP